MLRSNRAGDGDHRLLLCFIIGKFDIRRTLDKKVSSTLFDLFRLFSLHYVDTKVKICTEKFL